jgi:hypothetical protein
MTLTTQLGFLESAGLIQLAAIQPELEYLFRHVLVMVLTDTGLGLARHDYHRAAEGPAAVLRLCGQLGFRGFRVDLQLAQARGLIRSGRLDEAETVLGEARAIAEAKYIQRVLWELLAAQADLAEQRGEALVARQLRQESRAALDSLAAQITDPALRASLIRQPRTQAILGAAAISQDSVA